MKRYIRIIIGFCLTIVTLLILSKFSFFVNIQHAIQASLVSIGTGLNGTISRWTGKENQLIQERDHYQNLAAELAINQTEYDQLKRDVQEMESLLEYTETTPYNSIAARIVARSPQGILTFTINKGAQDGIQQHMAVVVENGHLVGYIDQVKQHTSTVTLLQHPESKTPAMIIGTGEISGLVEGQEGFLLHMDFIPQRTQISAGDIIVTSGLDGIFPQGLVIGIIDSVNKNETAAFQEAFVKPFFDVNTFTNVLVLDPFQENL